MKNSMNMEVNILVEEGEMSANEICILLALKKH